ncbi:MAG: GNAT family N-acetyltransferase [Clostridia bacterium]|nr:GNAT family N-acetyltransferase [Clostridia bacterium]
MKIKIRSERISDFNSIANVNYEAFLGWHPDNQYVSELILVDLLRHNSRFDPELSLVAELDGQIIGHVLFSPFKFIVLGTEQLGVVLAPIAVKPEFQKSGIGRLLIEEGHRIAEKKGIEFSLLCGHEEYYPRFGYRTGMFSVGGTKVNICAKSFNDKGFKGRPVTASDISWLIQAWKDQHKEDLLAVFPGESISEWCNHGLECCSSVIMKNDRILGYVRHSRSNPLNIKELLAKDEDVQEILSFLALKNYGRVQGEVCIALPVERLRSALDDAPQFELIDEYAVYPAFMVKVFEQDSPMAKYCEKVESGLIKPGMIAFPAVFDLADGRRE